MNLSNRLAYYILGALVCGLLNWGCVTTEPAKEEMVRQPEKKVATIKSIQIEGSDGTATLTVMTSEKARYSVFKLAGPPRLYMDIKGEPASDLKRQITPGSGLINSVKVKSLNKDGASTRIALELSDADIDYVVDARGNSISVDLSRRKSASSGADSEAVAAPAEKSAAPAETKADRTFFRPSKSSLNQVLGLDFFGLEKGKTRLAVTTSMKPEYEARLKGKSLYLDIEKSSIPELLQRRMDSRYFEGAVEQVKARSLSKEKRVSIEITLREVVPYHITQEVGALYIDFEPSSLPPKKTDLSNRIKRGGSQAQGKNSLSNKRYDLLSKEYAGQKMSFDFVDTDIRNILKLIAEAIGMNIVWGSDVEGKISLKLDNVPWDQALEMVLKPNDLTYTIEGNVMWVVPKAKLIDMEIKERERTKSLLAQKQIEEVFQPKVVEYIVIKNRKVEDIFRMLIGDSSADPPKPGILELEGAAEKVVTKGEEESKKTGLSKADLYITYDSGTNTIILNGVRSKIDKVKEMVAKLDVPEKQVMIQARIVDATSNFSRDLGVQWNNIERNWKKNETQDWGVTDPKEFDTYGDLLVGGSISSNTPSDWTPNLGVTFARLTNRGLGTIALDASLALAENEGKAHVISAPKVITMNGQEATISRGTILYKDIVTSDQVDTKEITATLSLKVTPTTSADNSHVTMTVEVTDDTAVSVNEKREKKIQTKLMVKNGETVVIGGIYKEDTFTAEAGYPWAKDVPIFGWLFKAQTKTRDKSELLIFLTPQVIEGTSM